jgi:signal transduction histidine kinase
LEALTGWTETEARGRPYADVLPVTGEQLLTRYGRKVPVVVSSAPILDQGGRVVGGVDVIRDVSREREIDEVKSALISTVSHELRTPLTLIPASPSCWCCGTCRSSGSARRPRRSWRPPSGSPG